MDPRDVVPFSDDEIRDLYRRARKEELDARDYAAGSSYDVIGLTLGLYVLAWVVSLPFGFRIALFFTTLVFIVAGVTLATWSSRGPLGPVAKREWKREMREIDRETASLDPTDPEVLQTVVEYVSRPPLERAGELLSSLAEDRRKVAESISALPALIDALHHEALSTQDEGIRALLQTKREGAERTLARLRQLDDALAERAEETVQAVQPVRDLVYAFERMTALGSDLARIQEAHGLADRTEEGLEDHRLQIRLLQAVGTASLTRLESIGRGLQETRQAEAELEASS